jgi:hypothetical protein
VSGLHVVQATHRCTGCGALWRLLPDGTWNLCSLTAGPHCCDNTPHAPALLEPITAPAPAGGDET